MKLLLITALVLIALAIGADVLARETAEDSASELIAKELGVDVSVTVTDFPFLPSVLRGNLEEVRLRAPVLVRDGLRLSDVEISMRSIALSFTQLARRDLEGLDVGRASGHATVLESELNQALPEGTRIDVLPGGAFTGTVNGFETEGELDVAGNEVVVSTAAGSATVPLPTLAGASYELRRTTSRGVILGLTLREFSVDSLGE